MGIQPPSASFLDEKRLDLLYAIPEVPPDTELLKLTEEFEEKLWEPPPLSGRNIGFSVGSYVLIVVALLILLVTTGVVPGSLESLMSLTGQQ